ncbi:MAG: hypothetical protein LBU42_04775 [Prevotellaceae bacterium]|jgi:hypothetical protein|nr:hypothetical protein [Prevotellaceae bacterium]
MKNLSILLLCAGLLQACTLNLPDSVADTGYENKIPVIEFDKYSVYFDYNNDGFVNKGETVGLQVWLKNTGTRAAKGVEALFSINSPYVSNFTPGTGIDYGDIAIGETVMAYFYVNYSTIQFTVSSSTPEGTQIPISISIVDESDNTWTSSFNVAIQ